jgi:oxygen-independent coproporphyrinogen-3 oxidase
MEGICLDKLDNSVVEKLKDAGKKYMETGLIKNNNNSLVLTKEGKLFADGIAAAMFF